MSNQLEKIKELIERRATARMGGGDKAGSNPNCRVCGPCWGAK